MDHGVSSAVGFVHEVNMALIVAFQNISGLAPVSNYRVAIYINDTKIAGDFEVKGHKRDDGWFKLLEQFVEENKGKFIHDFPVRSKT